MKLGTAFLGVVLFVFGATAHAANITYEIAPVTLGDGYSITGGFIETDGTLGTLSPNNITSYEASVTGPVPYVFSSSNPGSEVKIMGDVMADALNLTIGLDTNTGADTAGIGFFALDDTTAECFHCHQDLIFQNDLTAAGSATQVVYDHHDHSDDVPDSGYLAFDLGSPQVATSFSAVPEPQAWFGGCCALVGTLLFSRKKRS